MMSCGTPRPLWFPRNWGLKESLRPLVELRHPCSPHLTQEPNSPLNGRPPRLLCTAVSPSSQTSGLLGSYSPSLSPKAECPTQVSNSDKKPQRFVGGVAKVVSEGGDSQPVLSAFCLSGGVTLALVYVGGWSEAVWHCLRWLFMPLQGEQWHIYTHTFEIRWDHLVEDDQEIEHHSCL